MEAGTLYLSQNVLVSAYPADDSRGQPFPFAPTVAFFPVPFQVGLDVLGLVLRYTGGDYVQIS